MNLLIQTALILGLVSLTISAWTVYRGWRKKIAIEFAVVCLLIAFWALSFVTHATLQSRLAFDIHRFFNIWLSPLGVMFLGRFLPEESMFSKWLMRLTWGGTIVLSVMVTFSLQSFYDSSFIFSSMIKFWPSLIFLQFFNVVVQDIILKRPASLEFISRKKRGLLYSGVAIALLTCSMDHIPELGFVIPSIANLLFAAFLVFCSQVISPQKFLRIEALLTRFFATLIVALVITGFFALMFPYVSDSLPLFVLNSFLLSFVTLVIWNPLVSFFRYFGQRFFNLQSVANEEQFENFRAELASVTDLESLAHQVKTYFTSWIDAEAVEFLVVKHFRIPVEVEHFFLKSERQHETPILHRQLVELEIDQELTRTTRATLELLLKFLDEKQCDIVFPVSYLGQVNALVLVKIDTSPDDTPADWSMGFAHYTKMYRTLQNVGEVIDRLSYIEQAKERERLLLLGEMAAGLAHEVRNPLSAIRGAADLLDETSQPWAKVIKEEVARLNRLVSQFLDLSQVSEVKAEACDLGDIIEASLKNIRNSTTHTIHFSRMNISAPINAIPDHLQQVIINLVQNAIQATQQANHQAMSIEIKLIEQTKDQVEWVGFEVVDQGIGISEEQLNKVFQPFYTTFKNGTGLGLAICERLVRLNRGTLELSSRVNEGTAVKVYLPYAR